MLIFRVTGGGRISKIIEIDLRESLRDWQDQDKPRTRFTVLWFYTPTLNQCSYPTSSPGWIGLYVKLRCPYSTNVLALFTRDLIGCCSNIINLLTSQFNQNITPKKADNYCIWKGWYETKKLCYIPTLYCMFPDVYKEVLIRMQFRGP